MDQIKKDNVVIEFGDFIDPNSITDLDFMSKTLEIQKQNGMNRILISSKFMMLSHDPFSNPTGVRFMNTREETDEEYKNRMDFHLQLQVADDVMSDFMDTVCSYPLDHPDLSNGTARKQYDQLVYDYQKICIGPNPYDDLPLRLNDYGQIVFPLKKLEERAFAYPRKSAALFLSKWTQKHPSTEKCPVAYRDTLNIPFQEIKEPKS